MNTPQQYKSAMMTVRGLRQLVHLAGTAYGFEEIKAQIAATHVPDSVSNEDLEDAAKAVLDLRDTIRRLSWSHR